MQQLYLIDCYSATQEQKEQTDTRKNTKNCVNIMLGLVTQIQRVISFKGICRTA